MNDQQALEADPNALYREEVFTDQKTASIRRLTPVTADGEVDPSRPVEFYGSAQAMSPMGPVPLAFPLEAATVGEAAEKFTAAAQQAVQDAVKELEELRRQQALEKQSQIVVPGQQGGGSNIIV